MTDTPTPAAPEPFLARLERAATAAERAERAFRDSYYTRLAELERARVLASRRAHLLGRVSRAVASAPEEIEAHDLVARVLEEELGLSGANEGHRVVLDRFRPVTDAIDAETTDDEAVLRELADFEAWYRARGGEEFLSLCDVYTPETPRVDF